MKNDTGFDENTLGYHHAICKALFGPESKATKFLEEKAESSPNGMHEGVVVSEPQVVHLLGKLHMEGLDEQRRTADLTKPS